MNWVDKILASDAAKANPDAARRIIEAAGGHLEDAVSPSPQPAEVNPPVVSEKKEEE